MCNGYQVYKFAINTLNGVLDSVKKEHDKILKTIEDDQNNLCSSSDIADIMKDNEIIIISIERSIDKLSKNMDILCDTDSDESSCSLEKATNDLRQIMKEECDKIYTLADETKELLNGNMDDKPKYIIEGLDNDLPEITEDKDSSLNDKELDTIEYKKCCTVLNKSFWEARQKASEENIKYPSALYEKMVKEYQNEYLINTYNISLEEVESSIDEYKEKYAEDIYMDEIYDKSLYQLRQESSASVQELCDESYGLSMLDKRAYSLLQEDLTKIIKEIRLIKIEENLNESISISEYRKSFRLNSLIDKKEMIENQLYIISKRAKKLEQATN